MNKTANQKAWFFVLPVIILVAFNAIIPLMTVVNYSVQESFGANVFFWSGVRWFSEVLGSERFHASLGRQLFFTFTILLIEVPLGVAIALAMPRKGLLGVGLPRADGPAALDPVERRRRDLEHLRVARHRPARPHAERDRHRIQLHPAAGRCLVHGHHHGCLALDVAGRAARLCGAGVDPRCLLSGGQDRRRQELGDLPLHPAAENEARADHRDPAALHGQLQHLHRAVRADRRRPGQLPRRCCRSIWSRSRSASSISARRRPCR